MCVPVHRATYCPGFPNCLNADGAPARITHLRSCVSHETHHAPDVHRDDEHLRPFEVLKLIMRLRKSITICIIGLAPGQVQTMFLDIARALGQRQHIELVLGQTQNLERALGRFQTCIFVKVHLS